MSSPEEVERPRRVTLSHVVEMLLQRGGREHSSVTLSRNSKGDTQIEVVVRTDETGEIPSPDAALAKAIALYDQAQALYPLTLAEPVGKVPPAALSRAGK